MSSHHNVLAATLGIGLAGAVVGTHVYLFMSPGNQRTLQKSVKRAVDELTDLASEIGDSVRDMR